MRIFNNPYLFFCKLNKMIQKKVKIEFRINYESVKDKHYIFIREHVFTTWCLFYIPIITYETFTKIP